MAAKTTPATIDDVPGLLKLVEQYWIFEDISRFDPVRVSTHLERLCLEPQLGCGWISYVGDTPAGYLLAVYVFSLEHFGLPQRLTSSSFCLNTAVRVSVRHFWWALNPHLFVPVAQTFLFSWRVAMIPRGHFTKRKRGQSVNERKRGQAWHIGAPGEAGGI